MSVAPTAVPTIASVLDPAGPVAAVIAEMAWVLFVGAALLFCIVMAALLWALLRGQGAGRDEAPTAGDRRVLRRWLFGGGLVFPVTVLAALLIYAVQRSEALIPAPEAREPVITVKARLWWWEVRYDDPARGTHFVTANQIHLPVGRAVTLGLVSDDLIHSFWVPALAGKIDMVPGRVHRLRMTADRTGVFRGQCAEFCGEQHARMAVHVVAQTPADYERWLVAQMQPATTPIDPQALRGLQVFTQQRCAACHSVRGLTPPATLGPDLTHVGSRLHLGAGTLPMRRDTLRLWLAHTQQVKPGVRMPSYERLDEPSLEALSSFLEQLR